MGLLLTRSSPSPIVKRPLAAAQPETSGLSESFWMFPAVQLPNGIIWHPHRQLPAQRVGTPHSGTAVGYHRQKQNGL